MHYIGKRVPFETQLMCQRQSFFSVISSYQMLFPKCWGICSRCAESRGPLTSSFPPSTLSSKCQLCAGPSKAFKIPPGIAAVIGQPVTQRVMCFSCSQLTVDRRGPLGQGPLHNTMPPPTTGEVKGGREEDGVMEG